MASPVKVGFRCGLRHLEEMSDLSKAENPPTAQMHNPAIRGRKYVDGPSQRVVQLLLHCNLLWQRLRVRYALYPQEVLFSPFPFQRREAHLVPTVPLAYLIYAAFMRDPKQPPLESHVSIAC